MSESIKSVITLGEWNQFNIPKPSGDSHWLTDTSSLFVTPGYKSNCFDRKTQFPHALLISPASMGQIEQILAGYIPSGPQRPRRVSDILERSQDIHIDWKTIYMPESLAWAMRVRSTRVTGILLPGQGIDLQFTSKRHPWEHPDIWSVMNRQ